MDNPETQVIMGTRHRTKTKTTIKEQSRMDNPETQVIMGTRHRTKTNITITLCPLLPVFLDCPFLIAPLLLFLSSFCVLCPLLPVFLDCPFLVFVFVLCLVPIITCVSGLSILDCSFIVETKTTIKEQSRMDNPETQVIMGTRHRTKTNITITLHRKRK
jgi:hypothetical protein